MAAPGYGEEPLTVSSANRAGQTCLPIDEEYRRADGAGGRGRQAEGPQSGRADTYWPGRRIFRARPGQEARCRRTRLAALGSIAGMIALGTRPSGGGGIGEPEPGQGPGQRAGGRAGHLAAAGKPPPRPAGKGSSSRPPSRLASGSSTPRPCTARPSSCSARAGRSPRAGLRRRQGLDSLGGRRRGAALPGGELVRRLGRPDADPQPSGLAGAPAHARGRPGPRAGRPDRRHSLLASRFRRARRGHAHRPHRRRAGALQPGLPGGRADHPAAGRRPRPRRPADAPPRRGRAHAPGRPARPSSRRCVASASPPGPRP